MRDIPKRAITSFDIMSEEELAKGRGITREQLGTLRAGRYAQPFRGPDFDAAQNIAQGGTGQPISSTHGKCA